jgi:hypothetical protein
MNPTIQFKMLVPFFAVLGTRVNGMLLQETL